MKFLLQMLFKENKLLNFLVGKFDTNKSVGKVSNDAKHLWFRILLCKVIQGVNFSTNYSRQVCSSSTLPVKWQHHMNWDPKCSLAKL